MHETLCFDKADNVQLDEFNAAFKKPFVIGTKWTNFIEELG